jgi:hypothetical protein
MAKKNQKSRGFTGELIIDIPEVAIGQCLKMPLISSLYITKMGFYPEGITSLLPSSERNSAGYCVVLYRWSRVGAV